MACPECNDVGYLLNANHAGTSDPPVVLNLTACYYPECGLKQPPEIASLQVLGMFANVVRHPGNGTVMALTGFTAPVFR